MIFEKVKNTFSKIFNKGELVKSSSPFVTFEEGTMVIHSDMNIVIKGTLRIKTDKHMVLQTSRLPSNDEYEVYAIHIQPPDEEIIYVEEKDNE